MAALSDGIRAAGQSHDATGRDAGGERRAAAFPAEPRVRMGDGEQVRPAFRRRLPHRARRRAPHGFKPMQRGTVAS